MYKKVLVPICGKNHCERGHKALDKALKICDGEIILLHVTDPIAQVLGGEARAEVVHDQHAAGRVLLEPVVVRLQEAAVPFYVRIEAGTIADTIVHVAIEEKVDLIVMFTDGADGLQSLLLGSVTERVLRNTPMDLLAVRDTQ